MLDIFLTILEKKLTLNFYSFYLIVMNISQCVLNKMSAMWFEGFCVSYSGTSVIKRLTEDQAFRIDNLCPVLCD